MRRLASVLVLPLVVVAIGCGGYSNGGGSSSSTAGSSNQAPVSVAKCQKLVGASLFQVQGAPFTAKYRNAVDSVCKTPGLKSTSPTDVFATAQVAKQIANGTSP